MTSNKSATIGIRISDSIKEILSEIAARESRSVSQQAEYFIKQGVNKYIKEHQDFRVSDTEGKNR